MFGTLIIAVAAFAVWLYGWHRERLKKGKPGMEPWHLIYGGIIIAGLALLFSIAGLIWQSTKQPPFGDGHKIEFKSQTDREDFARKINEIAAIINNGANSIKTQAIAFGPLNSPSQQQFDEFIKPYYYLNKTIFEDGGIIKEYNKYNHALASTIENIFPDNTREILESVITHAALMTKASIFMQNATTNGGRESIEFGQNVLVNEGGLLQKDIDKLDKWIAECNNRIAKIREAM